MKPTIENSCAKCGRLADDCQCWHEPIMEDLDELESVKVQMRAQSEASLRLKRSANALLRQVDKYCEFGALRNDAAKLEREALRKAIDETPD